MAVKISDEKTVQVNELAIIAMQTHIVTQATSLIALETDSQRADLERYSEQEDKYDTKYENFASESPAPMFERGVMDNDSMMRAQSMSIWTSKSVGTFNNWGYADGLKLGSSSSSSALSLGSSSISSGGIVQYIIVIILFPLIAWFVLRRKPKAEVKQDEPTQI